MRIYKEPSLDYVLWFAYSVVILVLTASLMGWLFERDYDVRFRQSAESGSIYRPSKADNLDRLVSREPQLVVVGGKVSVCSLTRDDKLLCVGEAVQ
jgi:hypothetical protein